MFRIHISFHAENTMYYKRILTFMFLVLYSPNETVYFLVFYLLDLDPHLSMRIRIQEAYLYADSCGSGSETLACPNLLKIFQ